VLKPVSEFGRGLERPCEGGDWIRLRRLGEGLELLGAWFGGQAFSRHRHDTYAIGVTEAGVQTFDYRGRVEHSTPGQVVVLHPDEPHDGRPGTEGGFGYRIVYVDPARIGAAVAALQGGPPRLPFVREPVADDAELGAAVRRAFALGDEPLAQDALVLRLAELLARADGSMPAPHPPRLDRPALARARALLETRRDVVRSAELEAITGLSRWELSRQFRALHGTSPYRYSLLRRLADARGRLERGAAPGEAALLAGFADQAHFTRMFRSTYGVTPGRYVNWTKARPALASV
jgi:AraC-like DNA-binding protein